MRNRAGIFSLPAARWMIAAAALIVIVLVGFKIASRAVERHAEQAIRDAYGDELHLTNLHVTLFPRISASGENVEFRPQGRTDVPPLISIRGFSAETNWFVVFGEHVRKVTLTGLVIVVPPKREHPQAASGHKGHALVIDEVVADGAVLRILPKQENKEPLEFDLNHLTVHGAGERDAMHFETVMKNAKPPGEIHSSGELGPWQDEPGATPVSGSYAFDHADLSVFKGIAGVLSSRGQYTGELDRIEVSGETDVPDFQLKVSGRPVHLTTQFHAIVDGTDGNTYLQPVIGRFGNSTVTARGGVAGDKGQKKTVNLDAVVENGRLEDVLRLGTPGKSAPLMTGAISFKSKIVIPPGDVDIAQKLQLDGAFTVEQAHFSKSSMQEKINELSHRGSGNPQESAEDTVATGFRGAFRLDQGSMTFRGLTFTVPGVTVTLDGTYGMVDHKLDMSGTARLEAKLSQTTTGIKSFFLKALNPFFEKKNAGAVIPIHIGGTSQSPEFGLGKHR
jgi:AsmA-like C-terminal region